MFKKHLGRAYRVHHIDLFHHTLLGRPTVDVCGIQARSGTEFRRSIVHGEYDRLGELSLRGANGELQRLPLLIPAFVLGDRVGTAAYQQLSRSIVSWVELRDSAIIFHVNNVPSNLDGAWLVNNGYNHQDLPSGRDAPIKFFSPIGNHFCLPNDSETQFGSSPFRDTIVVGAHGNVEFDTPGRRRPVA